MVALIPSPRAPYPISNLFICCLRGRLNSDPTPGALTVRESASHQNRADWARVGQSLPERTLYCRPQSLSQRPRLHDFEFVFLSSLRGIQSPSVLCYPVKAISVRQGGRGCRCCFFYCCLASYRPYLVPFIKSIASRSIALSTHEAWMARKYNNNKSSSSSSSFAFPCSLLVHCLVRDRTDHKPVSQFGIMEIIWFIFPFLFGD